MPLPHRMFLTERTGQFAFGHVFRLNQGIGERGLALAGSGTGYWRCDFADGDRLTWSDEVYELFGLPLGLEIPRAEAVRCYSEGSRIVLERLREFSIRNACGFLIDANMAGQANGAKRMRVLSAPIVEGGIVVGLHGLKRAI